ncbi:phosphoribosyltransferase domain-containing protein [Sphingomonas sp.]|jgi:hypothetical protein|uniref:phosphoribosyltransferase domain-containing protein n=1 Tax=Sphingomonas sp. TaxID=28214 RepID=UPI002DF63BFE|nr:phosphoribosyltransferase domain-containing protein [Sphingomonas sp.]
MLGRAASKRAPALDHRSIRLPGGSLEVSVTRADWPLDVLCGFGARLNPKRGFLVVSKVLGRHIPAAPQLIRASARDLAARLPPDLPGPVLVLGLAETAVCLGQCVHAELRASTGRDDIFFIHSTRQLIEAPLLCRFEEPHSHASAHLIYQPRIEGFVPPRSLVLVDDELSTGTTLANLAEALVRCWSEVETIWVATLTNWSDGGWQWRMPRRCGSASLLKGRLRWQAAPDAAAPMPMFEREAPALGRIAEHRNLGRLGLREPLACPPLPAPRSGRLRILGTGEFTYSGLLVAEELQRRGCDVVVQATTRSPARIGGAIGRSLAFADNYGTGVPNYLYNADPDDGRETWIVHETGAQSIDPDLIRTFDARLIAWP